MAARFARHRAGFEPKGRCSRLAGGCDLGSDRVRRRSPPSAIRLRADEAVIVGVASFALMRMNQLLGHAELHLTQSPGSGLARGVRSPPRRVAISDLH